jgi:hypothetical protein
MLHLFICLLILVIPAFLAQMDIQNLLNDDSDVWDDLNLPTPLVPTLEKLLKLTHDEIHLSLLHMLIKYNANVLSLAFEAIPRKQHCPFKPCLLDGFKASALAFFKLFFINTMFNILVRNANLYATSKEAWTAAKGQGRRWTLLTLHKLLIWMVLHIYIKLCNNANIGSY